MTARSRLPLGSVIAPALLVGAAVVVMWLATSVGVLQLLDFAAYQLVFVLLPGCALYALLEPAPRRALRWIAFGWALGYVLEIVAFMITAAIGVRPLFWLYPLVVVAAVLLLARRSGRPARELAERPAQPALAGGVAWNWAAAIGVCLVVVYFVAGYVAKAPLPWRVPSVLYYTDLPFHISLAAEAANHWPITNPGISGLEQPYQNFVYMDMAGTTNTTGLSLPLIVFRLYWVPLVLAMSLQLVLAGRLLTRRAWGGPLALALVLLVGELDPDPDRVAPFGNSLFSDLYLSPTFLLGMALFLPVVIMLVDAWRADDDRRLSGGRLAMLVILLFGCSGAKGTILPVLGLALGGVLAWRLVFERRLDRTALRALVAVVVIFVVTYVTLYGARSTGGSIDPMTTILQMPVVATVKAAVPHRFLPLAGFWIVFLPIAIFGIFGPSWVGVPAALRGSRRDPVRLFLFACGIVALGVLLFLHVPGDSQLYFVYYGFAGAALASAAGLVALSQRRTLGARALVALAALVVLIGALDTPLDVFPPLVKRHRDHQPLYDTDGTNGRYGLTAGLYQGLSWVRDHTSTDAVIAVNNHFGDAGHADPRYFYYSGFGERRVFLESWAYNVKAYEANYDRVARLEVNPFAARLRLNDAAFAGRRAALQTLRDRYGVRYLFVDRVHGGARDLTKVAHVVFKNSDAIVYAI